MLLLSALLTTACFEEEAETAATIKTPPPTSPACSTGGDSGCQEICNGVDDDGDGAIDEDFAHDIWGVASNHAAFEGAQVFRVSLDDGSVTIVREWGPDDGIKYLAGLTVADDQTVYVSAFDESDGSWYDNYDLMLRLDPSTGQTIDQWDFQADEVDWTDDDDFFEDGSTGQYGLWSLQFIDDVLVGTEGGATYSADVVQVELDVNGNFSGMSDFVSLGTEMSGAFLEEETPSGDLYASCWWSTHFSGTPYGPGQHVTWGPWDEVSGQCGTAEFTFEMDRQGDTALHPDGRLFVSRAQDSYFWPSSHDLAIYTVDRTTGDMTVFQDLSTDLDPDMDGIVGLHVAPQCVPLEVCDGLDNDSDGWVDEGFSDDCG